MFSLFVIRGKYSRDVSEYIRKLIVISRTSGLSSDNFLTPRRCLVGFLFPSTAGAQISCLLRGWLQSYKGTTILRSNTALSLNYDAGALSRSAATVLRRPNTPWCLENKGHPTLGYGKIIQVDSSRLE